LPHVHLLRVGDKPGLFSTSLDRRYPAATAGAGIAVAPAPAMSQSDDFSALLSAVALDSVIGGNGINFDLPPKDVVRQVQGRIDTCNALQSAALNADKLSDGELFSAQAQKCRDLLK
jgi:hypothetical protein